MTIIGGTIGVIGGGPGRALLWVGKKNMFHIYIYIYTGKIILYETRLPVPRFKQRG